MRLSLKTCLLAGTLFIACAFSVPAKADSYTRTYGGHPSHYHDRECAEVFPGAVNGHKGIVCMKRDGNVKLTVDTHHYDQAKFGYDRNYNGFNRGRKIGHGYNHGHKQKLVITREYNRHGRAHNKKIVKYVDSYEVEYRYKAAPQRKRSLKEEVFFKNGIKDDDVTYYKYHDQNSGMGFVFYFDGNK